MRWSAIIGGVLVTAGVWFLLHTLGMGAGLTGLDPRSPGSLRGVGIGTGIWSIIVSFVALFAGGVVAGYLAGLVSRVGAVIHGAVLWSLSTLLSLLILVWLLGGLIGGVARVGGQVVGAAGSVAAQGLAGLEDASLESIGLSADDLVVPINERLRAAGQPTITAEQLRAAARDVLRTAVRQGRLDRALLVQSLAQQTALTRADAQEVATIIEQRWAQATGAASERARGIGTTAQRTALQAAEATGQALLVLFFLLLVGLAAAIGGVLLVVSRHRRRIQERITTIEEETSRPGGPPPPAGSPPPPAGGPPPPAGPASPTGPVSPA